MDSYKLRELTAKVIKFEQGERSTLREIEELKGDDHSSDEPNRIYEYSMYGHETSVGDMKQAFNDLSFELNREDEVSCDLLYPRKRILVEEAEECFVKTYKTYDIDHEGYEYPVTELKFYAYTGLEEQFVVKELEKLEKELVKVREKIVEAEVELKEFVNGADL